MFIPREKRWNDGVWSAEWIIGVLTWIEIHQSQLKSTEKLLRQTFIRFLSTWLKGNWEAPIPAVKYHKKNSWKWHNIEQRSTWPRSMHGQLMSVSCSVVKLKWEYIVIYNVVRNQSIGIQSKHESWGRVHFISVVALRKHNHCLLSLARFRWYKTYHWRSCHKYLWSKSLKNLGCSTLVPQVIRGQEDLTVN